MADEGRDTNTDYLAHLKHEWSGCSRCEAIVPHRTQLVWGHGPKDAMILIVSEAPGENEDKEGRPFVGAAGQNLDHLLNEVGMSKADIYLSNTMLCRPTKSNQAGGLANRPPTAKEVSNCKDRLISEILYVDPLLILTLGDIPTKLLLSTRKALSKVRGRVVDISIRTANDFDVKYPVLPTYHPSYLLQYAKQNEIYLTVKDLELARDTVLAYLEARGD